MNLIKLNNRYLNTENIMHISGVSINENIDSTDVRFSVFYNTENQKITSFNVAYPLKENFSEEEKDIMLKKVESIREKLALITNNNVEPIEIDKNINISKTNKKD